MSTASGVKIMEKVLHRAELIRLHGINADQAVATQDPQPQHWSFCSLGIHEFERQFLRGLSGKVFSRIAWPTLPDQTLPGYRRHGRALIRDGADHATIRRRNERLVDCLERGHGAAGGLFPSGHTVPLPRDLQTTELSNHYSALLNCLTSPYQFRLFEVFRDELALAEVAAAVDADFQSADPKSREALEEHERTLDGMLTSDVADPEGAATNKAVEALQAQARIDRHLDKIHFALAKLREPSMTLRRLTTLASTTASSGAPRQICIKAPIWESVPWHECRGRAIRRRISGRWVGEFLARSESAYPPAVRKRVASELSGTGLPLGPESLAARIVASLRGIPVERVRYAAETRHD